MLRLLLAGITLLWLPIVQGDEVPETELTAAAEQQVEWQPAGDTVDAGLQRALVRQLNARPEWRRLIQSRKLAVGLIDLSTETPRFARVNGDEMMYAASLPKIAVLLTAYASFEDGSLKETPQAHRDLREMIQVSSNEAATRMIDAVGMPKIERVMRAPAFHFYDEESGGGLWVGKRYAAAGARHGDPLHNISHGATVSQVARFYYLLAEKQLINEHRSEQMLDDLAEPALHHKFVAEILKRAPTAKVFRKSGTWRRWHSDSVLVQGSDWRNYILVALVESPNGENVLRELVRVAEATLHPQMLAAANIRR